MGKPIKSALISVFHKDGLDAIVQKLHKLGVTLYSTGGTQTFIESLGIPVVAVEDVTGYPSILGGRVKTLHPKVFGGILARRDLADDQAHINEYEIPLLDLVIVDLYPFEDTVASGAEEQAIIEKIDIGGISLIRAAAKNFRDTAIVASKAQYGTLEQLLDEKGGETDLADRKHLAAHAFNVSSHYDTAIFNYFNASDDIEDIAAFKESHVAVKTLRYGENPHQSGRFYGQLADMFEQLHGKELSYNNLVDVDAAVALMEEFEGTTAFAILKHTNACGVATAPTVKEAYDKAFAADTISAFGGILITNQTVDRAAAEAMHSLFFEVLIAPDFSAEALEVLTQKKTRILLKQKMALPQTGMFKNLLNGVIWQDRDGKTETVADLEVVTEKAPTNAEQLALVFANKITKHTKSNAIVLAKDGQLLASGTGQTSRVDALKQAIAKAGQFGFALEGAVMASEAFFPFPDCVEIAHQAGITAVVQPGGSKKDQASIEYCNANGLAMVFTGTRHFKH